MVLLQNYANQDSKPFFQHGTLKCIIRGTCEARVRKAVPVTTPPVAVTFLPPVPATADLVSETIAGQFLKQSFLLESPGSGCSVYCGASQGFIRTNCNHRDVGMTSLSSWQRLH